MCIGIPVQVIETFADYALCKDASGQLVEIDTLLLGPQQPGTWLLTFINSAREVISAERALQVQQALEALQAAVNGESFDHLFADLIDREPQLPEFLRSTTTEKDS